MQVLALRSKMFARHLNIFRHFLSAFYPFLYFGRAGLVTGCCELEGKLPTKPKQGRKGEGCAVKFGLIISINTQSNITRLSTSREPKILRTKPPSCHHSEYTAQIVLQRGIGVSNKTVNKTSPSSSRTTHGTTIEYFHTWPKVKCYAYCSSIKLVDNKYIQMRHYKCIHAYLSPHTGTYTHN